MFSLHPQLEQDCFQLGDLPLCRLLLMNDRQYPWLILVPRKTDTRELLELDENDQKQLMQESNLIGQLLLEVFFAEKLNVAALGNMVPQLHLHHIARFHHDPAWPAPVWGKHPALCYSEKESDEVKAKILDFLAKKAPAFTAVQLS
ncbi:MAG: HIT domain-containing protein [Pseudomonadales bacterium]|nr:HIT domain-containing protein [Pseudomonadales bacterium]